MSKVEKLVEAETILTRGGKKPVRPNDFRYVDPSYFKIMNSLSEIELMGLRDYEDEALEDLRRTPRIGYDPYLTLDEGLTATLNGKEPTRQKFIKRQGYRNVFTRMGHRHSKNMEPIQYSRDKRRIFGPNLVPPGRVLRASFMTREDFARLDS